MLEVFFMYHQLNIGSIKSNSFFKCFSTLMKKILVRQYIEIKNEMIQNVY